MLCIDNDQRFYGVLEMGRCPLNPPGALVIFALSQHVDLLGTQIRTLENITLATGFSLLIFSVLAGGVLEAITRIAWEQWLTSRRTTEGILNLVEIGE